SVPCEHVFLLKKKTATVRCNWIAADLMEALQMIKYAFKCGLSLNFTSGMAKDEKTALEATMAAEENVLKDVVAYIELLCSEK
ncbi:hypothetical protein ARMGADRAFT_949310, partial [Armillaria gallica]